MAKIKIEFELDDYDLEYLNELRDFFIEDIGEDGGRFVTYDQVLRSIIRRYHSISNNETLAELDKTP